MMIIQNKYFKYAILYIAGSIGILAFAPFELSAIIGISLLLLFWVIEPLPNNKLISSIIYGFIYGVAYFITQIYWIFYSLYTIIHAGLWVSLFATIGLAVYLAIYITVAIIIYVRIKTKSATFNLLLLFPSIWVIFEWLRGWVLGGYAWSDLGYTQVGNLFFRGYFRLLGEYGVSWISISLIGVVLIFIRYIYCICTQHQNKQLQSDFRVAVIYMAIIAISGSMLVQIQYTKAYGKTTSVALIQGNVAVDSKWSNESSLSIYYDEINKTKADFVVIPETAIPQFEMNLPDGYLEDLVNMAHNNGANLIAGIPKIIDNKNNYINSVMVLTNSKHPYYAKHHLVPYGEYIPARWLLGWIYKVIKLPMVNFSAGVANQDPITVHNQRLAFNICYENAFARELTHAAKLSTLMVNVSDMGWYGDTIAMNQHLQISQARALENERYFIQATNSSITAIINSDGEIQSQLPIFKKLVLKDMVQGRVGQTPFERFNNWLIISMCLIILFVAVVYAIFYNRSNNNVK